ncbi:MAG: GNAT family N-acetyltransferase [Candidatus Binatia bacterium]
MTDFEIKITRDKSEIQEAQRLRFEIFHLEMKGRLGSPYRGRLDADDYDSLCEHLIVRDQRDHWVVGTYRLLLGSEARRHFGFYSERDFNLENIKRLKGESLELGRSCIHKDYRDKALVPVMWQAIADYVRQHQVRYLFGCPRLHTTHPRKVSEFYSLLKERHYAPEEFRVYPVPEKSFPNLDENVKIKDRQSLFFRLPSLIKGYLRVGALLCGPPALDLDFGAVYFFLLLDVEKISSSYGRRFGFSSPKVRSAVA